MLEATSPSPIGGDLSILGSGERNSTEGEGPRGPSERERASHWAGVRARVRLSRLHHPHNHWRREWKISTFPHAKDQRRPADVPYSEWRPGVSARASRWTILEETRPRRMDDSQRRNSIRRRTPRRGETGIRRRDRAQTRGKLHRTNTHHPKGRQDSSRLGL